MVKLTTNHSHTFVTGAGDVQPIVFSPLGLGGFGDYAAAYTHFRVLKASYTLPRDMTTANGATPSAILSRAAARSLLAARP